MNKIVSVAFGLILLSGCQEKQYFRSASEIDLIKKMHSDYLASEWIPMRMAFADTASIWVNAWWGDAIGPDEYVNSFRNNSSRYARYSFDQDPLYEMIVTDTGEHWVNCLYQWRAVHKTGGEVKSVFQSAFLVKNNKIIKHTLIFNQLPMFLVNMQSVPDSTAVK